jgi:hypothetical protein
MAGGQLARVFWKSIRKFGGSSAREPFQRSISSPHLQTIAKDKFMICQSPDATAFAFLILHRWGLYPLSVSATLAGSRHIVVGDLHDFLETPDVVTQAAGHARRDP